MQPFYSIEDLVCMFEIRSPENIADALLASGVKLVHGGVDANVTQWRHQRPGKTSDGATIVMRGLVLDPDPDEVMVAYESLPASWKQQIDQYEALGTTKTSEHGGLSIEGPGPQSASGLLVKPTLDSEQKELSTKHRRTLLRIIRALLEMVPRLPNRGAAVPIEKQLQQLGFSSPRDDTIAKVIKEAQELEPS